MTLKPAPFFPPLSYARASTRPPKATPRAIVRVVSGAYAGAAGEIVAAAMMADGALALLVDVIAAGVVYRIAVDEGALALVDETKGQEK